MPESLYQLIYCSRNIIKAEGAGLSHEVEAILAAARRNNVRKGITGALLFTQTGFAQVLEGRRDAVEAIFERIQPDSRHRDITVLSFLPAQRRSFPAWSMAFAGNPASDGSDALASLMPRCSDGDGLTATGAEVLRLLEELVVNEDDAVFV